MTWTIKLSSDAVKKYKALDASIKKQIKAKLQELEKQDTPLTLNNTKALTHNLRGFYRIRAGKYRIVFSLVQKEKIISVVNIDIRSKVY